MSGIVSFIFLPSVQLGNKSLISLFRTSRGVAAVYVQADVWGSAVVITASQAVESLRDVTAPHAVASAATEDPPEVVAVSVHVAGSRTCNPSTENIQKANKPVTTNNILRVFSTFSFIAT